MKKFKISELECFSGVKAHTIRVWEQRYNIFQPERTVGNIRYYSLDELKLLLDIALLQQSGHRISFLSRFEPSELAGMVEEVNDIDSVPGKAINDLISHMFTFEIEELEDVLESCFHVLGIADTIERVIMPFIERADLISTSGSNEAHFVVSALRRKLMVAIESANPQSLLQKTALLFLPEREHFDLILLYAAWVLKSTGVRVLYLGSLISKEAVQEVASLKMPDLIISCCSQKNKLFPGSMVSFMLHTLPQAQLCIVGREKDLPLQPHNSVLYLPYIKLAELGQSGVLVNAVN